MWRRIAYFLPLLTAVALIGAAVWLFAAFVRPGPLTQPRTVVIQSGQTVEEIAQVLADKGVIDDPLVFDVGVRLANPKVELQPGEYQFGVALSARAVMNALVTGRRVPHKLVVPEGLTSSQVLNLVQNAEGLSGAITVTPKEGALLPQSYQYFWGETRDSIIERMAYAMDQTVAELWEQRPDDSPFQTPTEAVILASIVAKESGTAKERPMVASVLLNRLARNMKLESDVTVSYGIAREDQLPDTVLKRKLTRADLKRATPYNTYVNPGLPPTPICNVGRETLQAVLHPAKSAYLFFSASGTSGNAFARTVDEHNRNVERMRERTNPKPPPSATPTPSSSGENEAMAPDGAGDMPTAPR